MIPPIFIESRLPGLKVILVPIIILLRPIDLASTKSVCPTLKPIRVE